MYLLNTIVPLSLSLSLYIYILLLVYSVVLNGIEFDLLRRFLNWTWKRPNLYGSISIVWTHKFVYINITHRNLLYKMLFVRFFRSIQTEFVTQ